MTLINLYIMLILVISALINIYTKPLRRRNGGRRWQKKT